MRFLQSLFIACAMILLNSLILAMEEIAEVGEQNLGQRTGRLFNHRGSTSSDVKSKGLADAPENLTSNMEPESNGLDPQENVNGNQLLHNVQSLYWYWAPELLMLALAGPLMKHWPELFEPRQSTYNLIPGLWIAAAPGMAWNFFRGSKVISKFISKASHD
ncbi:hypothetical protein PGT21_031471 [Puccinia graminis f. sp. tritici]|uniref:Uncharacterized protein n=1 Tax=Puccinia graminis f. sp. tritici TaxID=56615 RepID=A0A5B0NC84_PUCGR|nr:hypothetical protein PGT21_031471 [Puccinia graminis f. sp. tritici]KAA1086303.1 hypothetical protein PGTUg99_008111 [Puccinia graminis f. sp. tritici]